MKNNFDNLIEKINTNVHFQSLKMTYVELIPYLIGIGVLYIMNQYLNLKIVNSFFMTFQLLYCVCINVLYAVHYNQLKKTESSLNIFFSLLMTFMFIYTDNTGDILRLVLPLLIVNGLGLEIIFFSLGLKCNKKIVFLPVPVTQYFIKLIPVILSMIYMFVVVYLRNFYLPQLILVFQLILQFFSSIVGMLLIVVGTCYFWVNGVHGVSIIGTLVRPFWMQMLMINFMCALTDQPLVYVGTEGFFQWFVWIGGSGATLGLVLLCRYFAKSSQLMELGKKSLLSSFFNINEQVIFGLPVFNNKYMKIPFFAVPIFNVIITYLLMYNGIIDKTFVVVPWVCPAFVGAYWVTGNIISVAYICVIIILSIIIYLPFFKKYDNSLINK